MLLGSAFLRVQVRGGASSPSESEQLGQEWYWCL